MHLEMIVSARNAAGDPDLFICSVDVTHDDRDKGLHYCDAKRKASDAGYEAPFVVYEEAEFTAAIKHLPKRLFWESFK